LTDQQVLLPPAVLCELFSDPQMPANIEKVLLGLPLVEIEPGYWQRAGALRAKLLAKGRRARLGHALVAQSCMDRGVPL
jgi:predicted nucleic acid-binding protein